MLCWEATVFFVNDEIQNAYTMLSCKNKDILEIESVSTRKMLWQWRAVVYLITNDKMCVIARGPDGIASG